jgi:hypothetical protein
MKNQSAFPILRQNGLTMRDYFAARMMPHELAKEVKPHEDYNYTNAAHRAYKMADAMMKVRGE